MENKESLSQTAHRKLTEYMAERKMRKTPERYEVLRVACGMKGLFSIDDLACRMEAEASFCVSRSTLFSTLELLVDAQLITKHTLARAAHYEFNPQKTPVVCVVCHECGFVQAVEKAEVNKYLGALKVRFFTVQQPVLYLHGLCRKCAIAMKKKTSGKNIAASKAAEGGKPGKRTKKTVRTKRT